MSQQVNDGFDAGNEFATPAAAVEAALKGDAGEPEVQPAESPEAPEGQPEERASWEDPRPDAEVPTGTEATKPTPAVSSIEVKGNRGVQKFDLNPENEQLKRTLQFGMVAPQWKKERDAANAAKTAAEARAAKAEARAAPLEKIGALAQGKHYEQAVRVALGEEGFAAFAKQLVEEALDYSDADPTRRAEIERGRADRQRAFEKSQADTQLSEREQKLAAREDEIESQRMTSLGTVALKQHDFSRVIEDSDIAHAMNQKLWRLSWADLEDLAEQGKDITPEAITAAFSQNHRVLSSVIKRQAQATVTKVVDAKKTDAKAKAQIAATERYPKQGPDLTGWNGTSSKDLLRMLSRK